MNRTRRLLAAAGALTGVAGLVISWAVAEVLQANTSAVNAVATSVGDFMAGTAAMDLAHLVGPEWDKPILVAGVVAFVLGASAYAGTQAARRPLLSDLVYLALSAIGFIAVLQRANVTPASVVGVVAGMVTWVAVHRLLTTPLVQPAAALPATDEADTAARINAATRRQFLIRTGITTGVVAAAGVVGRFGSRKKREVEEARRSIAKKLTINKGTGPAGTELDVPGIEPWRTPNDDFYLIDTAFSKPVIAPDDWKLRIHGMVDKEIVLTYDDLIKRARTDAWVTLCCVSNEVGGPLIGNAYWSGFLIRDILAEAGIKPGADAVLQTSDDGWTCGTPIEALTDDRDAMLAIAMNGEPLPIEHGFPVRMVVPGLYGFVSATKWLVDLEVTKFEKFDAYWTVRGWSAEGPVLTQSRIDVPREGDTVDAGTIKVGGSAWAQHTGIAKVEYQLDGGPWTEATLGTVPGNDTWVQWAGTAEVDEGDHSLVVRATDKSGYTQTAVRTPVIPSGATGWHGVDFEAS